jgi:AraC family transcriptional regulator of adaptative response / DNA-3-methyladenine glycosylase II
MNLTHEQCYEAVRTRNSEFDGAFYTGVLTTGIFCKPSCSSKLPYSKNVRFFESIESAKEAGLRACKRCKPEA